jgi:hypothetical protein
MKLVVPWEEKNTTIKIKNIDVNENLNISLDVKYDESVASRVEVEEFLTVFFTEAIKNQIDELYIDKYIENIEKGE